MNQDVQRRAILALRWSVGLVVIVQSLRLYFDPAAGRYFARTGLPSWVRSVLAWSEIAAGVLFLVPFTAKLGGYLLVVIFALAAVLHVLHGEFDFGALVVYAAAVMVSLAYGNSTLQSTYDRR